MSTMNLGLIALIITLFIAIYRLYFHPLSQIPGPLLGRVSSIFMYTVTYMGIEGRVLRHYHQKYNTTVLRISPNGLSISDSSSIHPIYVAGGGFLKDDRYQNFNLGPIVSIFSAVDTSYRDVRAKPVAPLFALSRLRLACQPNGVINQSIARFLKRLEDFKAAAIKLRGARVDILDLCARLSVDAVSGYLLGEPYGGLTEDENLPIEARLNTHLSINPFIFQIVAFARFSLLPHWLFGIVYAVSMYISSNKEASESIINLDRYATRLVTQTINEKSSDSYQARLLQVGLHPTEVKEQCKAVIFAGADSTAVMLATIIFHLMKRPDVLHTLQREVKGGIDDVYQLPYLRAVVKEGLRLGMANPSRLTRVVPADGLDVGGFHIPPGTIVGAAASVLHYNPAVFPDPLSFYPERWLDEGQDSGLRRLGMERSLFMFGIGSRACIGKNLAQQILLQAVKALAESDVLDYSKTCQENIEIIEWFNAEIKGHKLEIEWEVSL
ncbi:cytochrome P450 [Daldinia loculata]|uniref:cytochrome P450 n=1 Tax=Daldinia loculata TaxID=103429 RepID=UPI0020C411C6|nr:cytochrome P450 [Daldinia loculata]KAI1645977.1 cytochrome P450 [Daldinia loculata]